MRLLPTVVEVRDVRQDDIILTPSGALTVYHSAEHRYRAHEWGLWFKPVEDEFDPGWPQETFDDVHQRIVVWR